MEVGESHKVLQDDRCGGSRGSPLYEVISLASCDLGLSALDAQVLTFLSIGHERRLWRRDLSFEVSKTGHLMQHLERSSRYCLTKESKEGPHGLSGRLAVSGLFKMFC
jgi:hypothetical protein